jgi:hypothetical protein
VVPVQLEQAELLLLRCPQQLGGLVGKLLLVGQALLIPVAAAAEVAMMERPFTLVLRVGLA